MMVRFVEFIVIVLSRMNFRWGRWFVREMYGILFILSLSVIGIELDYLR